MDEVDSEEKDTDVFANIDKDPLTYVLKVVFCKWKPLILYGIYYDDGCTRPNLFQRRLGITDKVLSGKLHELEADGLLERVVYAEVPPKVEYHLSEAGRRLIPILDEVYDWAWHQMKARSMPIDSYSEMWHGYREKDLEVMRSVDKRNINHSEKRTDRTAGGRASQRRLKAPHDR